MSKYNVHIYTVVRVKVEDVEGENAIDAIKNAHENVDPYLYSMFDNISGHFETESAEEVSGYLVDELDENGEVDYEKTSSVSFNEYSQALNVIDKGEVKCQ